MLVGQLLLWKGKGKVTTVLAHLCRPGILLGLQYLGLLNPQGNGSKSISYFSNVMSAAGYFTSKEVYSAYNSGGCRVQTAWSSTLGEGPWLHHNMVEKQKGNLHHAEGRKAKQEARDWEGPGSPCCGGN